jgi:AcrR family transcriptional regulator
MEQTTEKTEPLDREGRRERKRRQMRTRIYDVARELFQEQGFDATTIEQIAERADISPATFFNHYQSKGGVMALMTSEIADHVGHLVEQHLDGPGSIRARLAGLAEDAARQIGETHQVARDVMLELVRTEGRPENTSPYLTRVHDPLRGMLEEGQRSGEVRSDEDAAFLAEMVLGALNTALTNWLADPNYPVAERLPRAAHFICDAIGAHESTTDIGVKKP